MRFTDEKADDGERENEIGGTFGAAAVAVAVVVAVAVAVVSSAAAILGFRVWAESAASREIVRLSKLANCCWRRGGRDHSDGGTRTTVRKLSGWAALISVV